MKGKNEKYLGMFDNYYSEANTFLNLLNFDRALYCYTKVCITG